jgi:hypothetical protein
MPNDSKVQFTFKENVLIAHYKSTKAITVEIAKELVRLRKIQTNQEPCKLIIVLPKLSSIDKAGRDYLSSAEAKEGIIASAMVAKSILGRVVINFFLKMNNNSDTSFPFKVFNDEDEAFEWIKKLDLT